MSTNLRNAATLHPGALTDGDIWSLSRLAWLIGARCDPLASFLNELSTREILRRMRMANDPGKPPLECGTFSCEPWTWAPVDLVAAISALWCFSRGQDLSRAGRAMIDRLTMVTLASLRSVVTRSDGKPCRPTAPL